MSEWLVRTVDKVNEEDPHLDAQCFKRGDVIVICEDGWPWSEAERANPEWTILKFPGVSVEAVDSFLGPEINSDPKDKKPLLRRRAFMVNLDHQVIGSASRSHGVSTLNLDGIDVRWLRVRKDKKVEK